MSTTARPRPGPLLLLVLAAAAIVALLPPPRAEASPATSSAEARSAAYLEVTGFLDSPAVSFLVRQIHESQEAGTALVILRLDSPGGLDASIQPVVHAIIESRVPVLVWIAPGDARAGSAAVALALAAHHAVIAPEATLGPAHPLDLAGYRAGEGDDGAAAGYLQEVAEERRRTLPAGALRRLVSEEVGAEQAVALGAVDGTAATVQQLLQSIQGLPIEVGAVRTTLPTDPLTLRFVKMALVERLVHTALQPEFAYLLLLLGLFGLIFELYNPGLGAGGIAGAVAIGFSVFAFTSLPVSWLAVAALILAFLLLTVDLSRGGLGALSYLGGALLIAGTAFLYPGAHPAVRMSWVAGAGGVVMAVLFFISVMTSAIRARTAKPIPGADGILGAVGVARTDIDPDGQVMARGTLWRARTLGAAIAQGTAVKVEGTSGLMLMVEPTNEAPAQSDVDTPVDVDEER